MAARVSNWSGAAPEGVRIPVRSDHRPYRFEMMFNGFTERAYADTPDELLGFLISGYARLDERQRHAARIKFAVRAQVITQAEINTGYDLGTLPPGEQAVLTGHRNTPPEVEEWAAEVPLVLVDVYYQPLGSLPRPVTEVAAPDNLLWISPADPYDLLVSLHRAGFLILNEHRDYQA
jgi:hypothetical protein